MRRHLRCRIVTRAGGPRSPSDNDPPAPRPRAIDPHPDAESAREPEAARAEAEPARAEAEPAREEAQRAREETERLGAKRAQAQRAAPEPAVVSSWHPSPRRAAAPSEPAVEEPRRPSSRRRRNAILASVVAVACAVGGYLVGEAAKPPREPVKVVTAGALALELPADWERRPVPRVLFGVTLRDAVAASPGGTPETGIVAGRTQRTGDDLLPNRLGPARVPAAEPVRLGRHEAHRHRDLGSDRAGRQVTAYSIPTEAGTVVVACHAATAAARSFMAGCERVASTLELRGLRPVSLGAGFAERGRLARTVARLRRARDAGRRRLAAAGTPAQQAREARALRAAYAAARPAFAKLDAAAYPARWKARVLIVLRRIERSYARLVAAAARRSRSGYTRAGRRVTRWEAGLQRLIAAASR